MVFHTFGDSHSEFGWKLIPRIKINHLSAKLCYSFGRDKLSLLNIKNYNVSEGDSVLFSFGEIDCRAHIYKHDTDDNQYPKIIDDIIDNYFIAIKLNVSQYNNLNVFIYFVPPSDVTTQLNEEELQLYVYKKINKNEHSVYPWLGTNEIRKKYFLYFYNKLKQKCIEYNYIMFDIYNQYCDENGFIKQELSDGTAHINNPIYINEFIISNNISI